MLAHYDTPGSIGGEGACFFMLSNDLGKAACAIQVVQMLWKPTWEELQNSITGILAENGLKNEDIDIMVCGMNGDSRNSFLIDPLIAGCAEQTTIATFKQFCGEYDTASGFGLWLVNYMFTHKRIPAECIYKQGTSTAIKNVLMCNVTIAGDMTLVLVKSA